MAEIDTSIYRNNQPNAIQQFGQMAGTMNALMQNRVMQQQMQTNLATSDAVKQATNPITGEFDPRLATARMSQGPAAYNLPQFMQQMTQQQQAQVGLDTSKFDLANKQLMAVRTALSSILAKPDASPTDYIHAAMEMVKTGMATPKMVSDMIATMPKGGPELKQWGINHLVNTMTAQERLNAVMGTPQMQQGVDAQGRPMQIPLSVSPIAGVNVLPVNQGNAQPGSAPQGVMPGGQAQPNAGGLPVAQSQTGSTGLVTGMAPGQKENLESSAKAYSELQNEVGNSGQRVFQLQEALRGLQGTNTGPGTEFRNTLESYLLALPGAKGLGIVDEKGVINYDKAQKYLTQIASSQPGAMGSDAKLATASLASPSTKISNEAAKDIVKVLIGAERVKQAQADIFGKTGALPGEFSKWAVQWSKNVDPRAFSLDMLDGNARAELVNGLKGAERRKFFDSVKLALAAGVIDPAAFQAAPTK